MEGYATPSALVFALGLALVTTAMVQRSAILLRLSRADLDRFEVESILDGAQLTAAAQIVRTGAGNPYLWSLSTDAGWVEVVAESEADKLSLQAASELGDDKFRTFGVSDIAPLKARIVAAAHATATTDVGSLDDAPLWRLCAPSMMSGFGTQSTFAPVHALTPRTNNDTPAWRVGEVWRIRVTTAAGWRDDRIVRFTGDALHPVAVVVRRLSRDKGEQGQCDAILAAAA